MIPVKKVEMLVQIFTKKNKGEYYVFKDLKSIKYEDAILPNEGGMVEGTKVYPV